MNENSIDHKIDTNESESIYQIARKRRRALGLTQRELADISGCGEAFIVQFESGKSTVRLDKVSAALNALGLRLRVDSRGNTP